MPQPNHFSQAACPTCGSPAVPDTGLELLQVRAVDSGSSTESARVGSALHICEAVSNGIEAEGEEGVK